MVVARRDRDFYFERRSMAKKIDSQKEIFYLLKKDTALQWAFIEKVNNPLMKLAQRIDEKGLS